MTVDSTSSSSNKPRRFNARALGQIAAIVLILAAGIGIAQMLAASKTPPTREHHAEVGPLVGVERVSLTNVPVIVQANGTVEPRHRVDIVPQVSGKIVAVHESLIEGGHVKQNDVLLRIDPSDYDLALEMAEAKLAEANAGLDQARAGLDQARAAERRAETALAMEQADAETRVAEWRSARGEAPIPALVAREPQIKERQAEIASARAQYAGAKAAISAALAAVVSAKTAVASANLNLQRTTLRARFDGRIISEVVDEGQFVVASQTLASMYGTDRLQIVVPLEDSELGWFDLPAAEGSQSDLYSRGVPTLITTTYAGKPHQWQGRAVRTAGQVDPRTRMVDVMIEVNDTQSADGQPLVPGMFVKVGITGRTLTDVVRVPRHAVRAGDVAWVVRDGVLRVVPVTLSRTDRNHAYVSSGLNDGELVVTTQLDVVVDGMKVRIPEPQSHADQAQGPSSTQTSVKQ